jgi:hypothetical protein
MMRQMKLKLVQKVSYSCLSIKRKESLLKNKNKSQPRLTTLRQLRTDNLYQLSDSGHLDQKVGMMELDCAVKYGHFLSLCINPLNMQ